MPPQTGSEPFTAVRPAGNVSVNATPDSAATVFAFAKLKAITEVSPTAMEVGINDLVMVGAVGATVMVAVLLVLPVPPCVELTAVVVLLLTPALAPVTVTLIVQEEIAAITPPVKVSKLPPETTRLPPQTAVVPFTAVRPAGSGSVKATPVKLTVLLGLLITKLNVAVPAKGIAEVENDLLMVGGALTTMTAVLLGLPVPRLEDSAEV
jgi:hypothetical protein